MSERKGHLPANCTVSDQLAGDPFLTLATAFFGSKILARSVRYSYRGATDKVNATLEMLVRLPCSIAAQWGCVRRRGQ